MATDPNASGGFAYWAAVAGSAADSAAAGVGAPAEELTMGMQLSGQDWTGGNFMAGLDFRLDHSALVESPLLDFGTQFPPSGRALLAPPPGHVQLGLGPGVGGFPDQQPPSLSSGLVQHPAELFDWDGSDRGGGGAGGLGVGARRHGGFNLRLDLSAVNFASSSPAQLERYSSLNGQSFDQPQFSLQPSPPLRPPGPGPSLRQSYPLKPEPGPGPGPPSDRRLVELANARLSSDLGLPPVKRARDQSDPIPNLPKLDYQQTPVPTSSSSSKPSRTFVVTADCQSCAQSGVKLILRGTAIRQPTFRPLATFTCALCVPSPGHAIASPARLSYDQTVSAAIDRLVGLQPEHDSPSPSVPRSVSLLGSSAASAVNKMMCDCCQLPVGIGEVVDGAQPSSGEFTLSTEIVCTHCLSLYKLCSDCGGGGGRLSIGRWRCKELFPHSRRTCRLSHARHPRLEDLSFSSISLRDYSPPMLTSLINACRLARIDSRLQFTARPTCLEHGVAPCINFGQAERLAIDDWNMIQPLLSSHDEAASRVRRYISFSSAPASSRRAKYQAKTGTGDSTASGGSGSILGGFVVSEWDMDKGTLNWASVTPWGRTGAVSDGLSALCRHAVAKVRHDVALENSMRLAHGASLLPPLQCIWGLFPFDLACAPAQRLAAARGFETLAEARLDPGFVNWERSVAHLGGLFPPERDSHVPRGFVGVYTVVVRLLAGSGDSGGPPEEVEARRRRKGTTTTRSSTASPRIGF